MTATLKQIAETVNVSPMTVSNALRGKGRISDKVRNRILQTARELNYQPNLAARALRTNKSLTIGLLTGALNVDPTNVKVASFDEAARAAKYITMMTFSPNDQVEDELIRNLIARQVDGIVVYPAEVGDHAELSQLVAKRFPVVTIDGHGRTDLQCSDISTDYFASGELQAKHLIETGCRRLCQINSLPNCYSKAQLRAGFVETCAQYGLEPLLIDIQVPACMGNYIDRQSIAQLHAALDSTIDAIDGIASYDLIALAALRVLWEKGLRIPDDISVIGSDDSPMSNNSFIPMTTIAQPSDEIGRRAFELIHNEMKLPKRERNKTRELAEPVVVPRQSTLN